MGQTVDLPPALWLTTSISGTPTDAGGPYAEQQLNYLVQALHGTASGKVSLGDLVVAALSPTAGAQVTVSPGGAFIAGSSSPQIQGVYLARSTSQVTLDVPAASTSIARHDIVVIRVLDKTYDGNPVSGVNYRTRIEYIQGDQVAGTAPATPANCLVLASITVPAGSSTVVQASNIVNATPPVNGADSHRLYRGRWTATVAGTANTGFNKLALPGVSYDPSSMISGGNVTAPIPGYYEFKGMVGINATAVTQIAACAYKNGALVMQGGQSYGSGALTAQVTDEIYLNAGDYLSLYIWTGATMTTLPSGSYTGPGYTPFFEVKYTGGK